MVFSADGRVLIKVLRQKKGYGAKIHRRISLKPDLGELQERVYRSRIHDVDQLKSLILIEELEHFHQVFTDEAIRQCMASTSSSLHSNTRRAFWTHRPTLVMFDICTDVHFDSHVCAVAYSGHFCLGGDLTKPSITIASVDRFYLNLVVCLQLDIALLVQNSVKFWHCLSELWQCIQEVTFFLDTL